MYFDSVWDFDLALGNHEAFTPTNVKNFFGYPCGGSAGTLNNFVGSLIENKDVESSELNFLKLDNNKEKIPWEGPNYESEDYVKKNEKNLEESVQVLKDYVKLRFGSLRKLIANSVQKPNKK